MNSIKLSILIISIAAIINTGCKSAAIVRYDKKLSESNSINIENVVFENPKAIKLNESYKYHLSESDKSLSYIDSLKSINSFYHTLKSNFIRPGRYQIEILSLCNCFGFNKFVFIPMIEIPNKKHSITLTESEVLNENWKYGWRIRKVWEVQTKLSGNLEIVLYSDNSGLDQKLEKSTSITPLVLGGLSGLPAANWPMKAGYQGKYVIQLNKLE